jgi:hypothetical protein
VTAFIAAELPDDVVRENNTLFAGGAKLCREIQAAPRAKPSTKKLVGRGPAVGQDRRSGAFCILPWCQPSLQQKPSFAISCGRQPPEPRLACCSDGLA